MKKHVIDIERKVLVEGRFHFVITNNETGEVRELKFKNLLLDGGMNRLASVANPFSGSKIVIGTSNTPAATNQTGLLGTVTAPTGTMTFPNQASDLYNTTTSPYWRESTFTQTYQTGVSGTFREVGIRNEASGVYLCRAVIADSGGTPVDLIVTSAETLIIYYAFRVYCPMVDATGTLTMGGTTPRTHDYICRAAQFAQLPLVSNPQWSPRDLISAGPQQVGGTSMSLFASSSNLGAVNQSPTGSAIANLTHSSGTMSVAATAYVTDSYLIEHSCTFGVDYGNDAGGIKIALYRNNFNAMQVQYTPPIPKTSFDNCMLRFRTTLARYVP